MAQCCWEIYHKQRRCYVLQATIYLWILVHVPFPLAKYRWYFATMKDIGCIPFKLTLITIFFKYLLLCFNPIVHAVLNVHDALAFESEAGTLQWCGISVDNDINKISIRRKCNITQDRNPCKLFKEFVIRLEMVLKNLTTRIFYVSDPLQFLK